MSTKRDEQLLEAARLAELGLLTATLNHELRQPLFAIRALAQLALADGDGSWRGHVEGLISQTQHMERLLDGIRDFSRQHRREPGPVDLPVSVRTAVDLLRHSARNAGVQLALENQGSLPSVHGDPTGLVQVAVNLLQNAIDASKRGQVVRIRLRSERPQVVLEVIDDGAGVPMELRERIFEPFFTTKQPGKGTGLGLHIARQLVEGCGGELRLLDMNRGACIQARLQVWKA